MHEPIVVSSVLYVKLVGCQIAQTYVLKLGDFSADVDASGKGMRGEGTRRKPVIASIVLYDFSN